MTSIPVFDPNDPEAREEAPVADWEEGLECLDDCGEGTCSGPVEFRMPLSGTGRSFPRCEKHWAERLKVQEGINRRYPDSPIPPVDFDPTYAGERWDEEY